MKLFAVLAIFAMMTQHALAHEDPGKDKLNDFIVIKELTALTDQDDGGGESEYCLRVKASHGAVHDFMDTDMMICADVNWDDDSDVAGKDWDELVPLRLPLIGAGGYMGPSIYVRSHFHECGPTEAWELSMSLYEIDDSPAGEMIRDIGEFVEKEGTTAASVAGLSNPGVVAGTKLVGSAARLVGKWVDRLVNGTTFLGSYQVVFNDGEGDPDQTIDADEEGTGRHFRGLFTKIVAKIGTCAAPRHQYFIARVERRISEAGGFCYSSDASPFCLNAGPETDKQFKRLGVVAARIDTIKPEPGTLRTTDETFEIRRSFAGLIGGLAQTAAYHQVERASIIPSQFKLLFEIEPTLASADQAYDTAVEEGSGGLLGEAIQLYSKVHNALSAENYGAGFQERWATQLSAAVKGNAEYARFAKSIGRDDVARGYIGQMLQVFSMLDAKAQAGLFIQTNTLFGAPMTEFLDLPFEQAVNKLLAAL